MIVFMATLGRTYDRVASSELTLPPWNSIRENCAAAAPKEDRNKIPGR